jgi:glutamate-5-semialdehyde dehydrogenase
MDQTANIKTLMFQLGKQAKAAARDVALATAADKNNALIAAAKYLDQAHRAVLTANELDLKESQAAGRSSAMLDRLRLDENRLKNISVGLREIAALHDPIGEVIAQIQRPNGLQIQRVRTPLGVIGVIYESRPNVTADAGALCLKAGNAVILRGGSDSFRTSQAIHQCMVQGLVSANLPANAIQLVPTMDRQAVGELLSGLNGSLDVVVPRGGKSLVARVQSESRVPVFSHLEGICHVFVERHANLEMAKAIVLNSKMRRTGICGAAETLLIDSGCVHSHLVPIVESLKSAGCQIRGDKTVCAMVPDCRLAAETDWSTEYLDAVLAVRVVDGIEGAIEHINQYSSSHTESIITDDSEAAEKFLNEIDSAILLHNASTQFADGGEFGMGAEIGIATGKMHARGPVGVEQLTSFKYQVRGSGQIRTP